MNLVSCRTARELVERHFVDSLAVGPWICDAARIVDLGSGAGFPGVPLAIAHSDKQIVLVESRRRRANFLREAKRALGLANVRIVEARAEDESHSTGLGLADAVVCRAVWADAGALAVAPLWLRPGGVLVCMRGGQTRDAAECAATDSRKLDTSERTESAPSASASELTWEQAAIYRVGAGPRRTLDIYRRGAAS